MIKIGHLKKVYPNAAPLKDISVEINDGDVIAVIGPSGTGKSAYGISASSENWSISEKS